MWAPDSAETRGLRCRAPPSPPVHNLAEEERKTAASSEEGKDPGLGGGRE